MLSCMCHTCLKVSREGLWSIFLMHTVIIFLSVLFDKQTCFTSSLVQCGIYVILCHQSTVIPKMITPTAMSVGNDHCHYITRVALLREKMVKCNISTYILYYFNHFHTLIVVTYYGFLVFVSTFLQQQKIVCYSYVGSWTISL